MKQKSTQELMQFAFEAVQQVGAIALQYFRQPALDISNKKAQSGFDPVTQADKDVELALRELIAARYPNHAILGEEQADKTGESEYCWVIDPIDGTRAFMSGMPTWGVLLGLRQGADLLLGVLHQPFTQETFLGSAEGAYFTRGSDYSEISQRLRTREIVSLAEASLYCTHPSMYSALPGTFEAFSRVAQQVRLMRYGGDCYSYGLLAMGQIDLVIEADLQTYDIMPLIPIIEAAGGVVTSWEGGSAANGGKVIAAANTSLHTQALALLNT